ncbi:phospholipid carrier-dependent glycosyltransferase [Thermodesulfobacteriota bacterium]
MTEHELQQSPIQRETILEIIFLVVVFLTALAIRELIYVRLFPDSIMYLTFARNILSGIHNSGDISMMRYFWSPLYSHLVAFFSSTDATPFELMQTGRQISIITGSLLIFPVYFLGRNLFGRVAAGLAVCILALTPEFIYYSGAVLTESLATLFIALAMLVLWLAGSSPAEGDKNTLRRAGLLALLMGILLGLAFLSRHAVIGFAGVILVWLIYTALMTHRPFNLQKIATYTTLKLVCIALGFVLMTLPQVLYLHSQTGEWGLTVSAMGSHIEKRMKEAGGDYRHTEDYEAIQALTPDAAKYVWENDDSPSMLTLIRQNPGNYLKAYFTTLLRGYLPDTYPLPYPYIILFFAAIGLVGLLMQKKFTGLLFCLWGFGGYYLFLVLYLNMRDRYMFPAYPFLLLLAGAGAAMIAQLLLNQLNRFKKTGWLELAPTVAVFLVLALLLAPASFKLIKIQNQSAQSVVGLNNMGIDLAKRIEKNALIFDRTAHLPYFAGGIFCYLPYAEIDEVVRFARLRGVQYWVISSSYVLRVRPQFRPLLNPNVKHAGLQPIAVYPLGNRHLTVVYKFLPE